MRKLIETFGKLLKVKRSTNTPGTPRKVQQTAKADVEKLNDLEHHTYRSGVGSLMYLLKHSRPELSNPMRELSRCLNGPSVKNMEEMY